MTTGKENELQERVEYLGYLQGLKNNELLAKKIERLSSGETSEEEEDVHNLRGYTQQLRDSMARDSESVTNQERLKSFYDSEGFLMIDSFDLDEASPDNRGMNL